jgi:surface antigen
MKPHAVMQMRRAWILVTMIGLMPTLAFGQTGWGRIMQGGPFGEFHGNDWDIFRSTVTHAADSAPDSETITWSNAKTAAHGDVKVMRRFERPNVGECRDLGGQVSAKGRTGPFRITLCRKPGGTWMLA